MWFNYKIISKDELQALHNAIFDLGKELFEASTLLKSADEKLTVWVRKHDELLVNYKELQAKFAQYEQPKSRPKKTRRKK